MTIQYETGMPAMLRDGFQGTAGLGTNALVDASGEKVAFIGNVWHPTIRTGTINIRKVHFRLGAVTFNAAGGSQFRVSLQDVSQTAGPPYQPDGTQDQFYDFKTATTALTANAWQNTGNLSADRAVNLASDSASDTNPRRVAVVFEYQVFNTSDSIIVSALSDATVTLQLAGVLLNTGSWAQLANRTPILAFECDDGSFAFMHNAAPFSLFTSASVSSNGAIRRAGLKFKFPSKRVIDRAALSVRVPNGGDGRLVLYDSDGVTELRSVDVDNDDVNSAISDQPSEVVFEPVTLEADTYYRWVWVGSTTTAVNVNYATVSVAGLLDGVFLGQNGHWTQHNGTAWTDTTTQRPYFGLGVCGYETGGLLLNSGMQGGLRG